MFSVHARCVDCSLVSAGSNSFIGSTRGSEAENYLGQLLGVLLVDLPTPHLIQSTGPAAGRNEPGPF
jgi:hypothetical protein